MYRCFSDSDIENIIIVSILSSLFLFSLKKRKESKPLEFLVIEKDYSLVLKGIACVFVLMGHYVNLTFPIVSHGYLSKFVYATTANIGLTWFMFFSGYGLSLKECKRGVKSLYVSRLKNLLCPFLFVCLFVTVLYAIVPNKFSPDEVKLYRVSHYINEIQNGDVLAIIKSLIGWLDWYVYCILIFYSIYYISVFIASKWNLNITIILALFFACYFVWAYNVFGPSEAHWYRYIWAFLLGHIVAIQDKISKPFAIIVLFPFSLLILLESKTMIFSYFIAVIALYVVSKLGQRYAIRKKSPLLFLGSVSYFYYLAHVRIGWHCLVYTNIFSVLVWTFLSLLIAYLLKLGYDKATNILST